MSTFSINRTFFYFKNISLRIKQIGLGRYLSRVFAFLGMPLELNHFLIRTIKIFINPVSYYKSLNYKYYSDKSNGLKIPYKTKMLFIKKEELNNVDSLLNHCRKIYLSKKNYIKNNYVPPYSLLLNNDTLDLDPSKETIQNLRPIINFASQPLLIGVLSNYFKQIPIVISITLNYTECMKSGEQPIHAQRFHRDINDKSIFHLVMPIYDISDKNGPFTFIDVETSKKIISNSNNKTGRINDDLVYKYAKKENIIKLTGKAGQACIMSPFYSIHCGGRVKEGFRLLLIISYAIPNLAVESVGYLHRKNYKLGLTEAHITNIEKKLLNIYN